MIKEFYMVDIKGLKWYQRLFIRIMFPENKKYTHNGDMKTEILANIKAKGNRRKYINYYNELKKGV